MARLIVWSTCCCAVQIDQSARRRLTKAKHLEVHLRTGSLVIQRRSVQIAHDGRSDSRSNTMRQALQFLRAWCLYWILKPDMESLMPDKPLPALLSKDDLCASLGISKRTIENMVRDSTFPPPVRLGKCVFWSEVAVHNWRRRRFASQEAWQC